MFNKVMNVIKKAVHYFLIGVLIGVFGLSVNANTVSQFPLCADNTCYSSYGKSYFTETQTGYLRVFLSEEKLYAEEYTKDFKFQKRIEIPMELKIYGGFYAGSDAYYFAFGQANEAEVLGSEVVRVVKYDKEFNKIGVANLVDDNEFAHDVRYPFWGGTFDMKESGGNLYLATGHQSYVDPSFNMGHQGYLLFVIDEKTMTGKLADADNWHSFSQNIVLEDSNNFYLVEESEGSRGAVLSQNTYSNTPVGYWGNYVTSESIYVLKYGGVRTSSWAISTYATVDGIALSDSNVLTVGSSIDQERYDDESYDKKYNVYLTVTPKNKFTEEATKFIWLNTDGLGSVYRHIWMEKLSDDQFVVMWDTGYTDEKRITDVTDCFSGYETSYVVVDGNGNVIIPKKTLSIPLSDCEPLISNGKCIYYVAQSGQINFYAIDIEKGDVSKKIYRMAVDIDSCSVEYAKNIIYYTGKEITPKLFVQVNDTNLVEGVDYTLSYSNNVNIGTGTVTIRGIGKYKGTAQYTFDINPAKLSIKKITSKKGKITVNWRSNAKQGANYKIQYSTKKSFKNKKTVNIKSAKTASTVIKKLKSRKKYYVRIRPYKKVKGRIYSGPWSKIKSVTVK